MPWTDREWHGRHEFFRDLPAGVRAELPSELRDFTYKTHGSLAQLHYGDPRLHYEAWFHWRTGRLELGLHLERDERANQRLFDGIDRYIVEIKHELGSGVALEGWDRGWARLYETHPCDKVDPPFRAEMTRRFAQIIAVLQPVLQSIEVGSRG